MSSWAITDNSEIEASQERRKLDPNQPKEVAQWQGLWQSLGYGVERGGVKIYKTAALAAGTVAGGVDYFTGTNVQEKIFEHIYTDTNDYLAYWTPDTASVGESAQMAGAFGEMVLPLVLGRGNVTPLVATQSTNTGASLIEQNVSPTTALAVSGVEALTLTAGAKIPAGVGGSLGARVVTGAGGNVWVGMAQNKASKEILNVGGYQKQANQYSQTMEAGIVDIGMGSVFGGLSHFGAKPRIVEDAQSVLKTADSYQNQSSHVIPKNAESVANHTHNMELTFPALAKGEPIPLEKFKPVQGEPRPLNYQTPVQPALFSHKTNALFKEQVNPGILKTGAASDIHIAAKNTKVKGEEALLIASIETGGQFNTNAKNPESSAHGVFQVTDKTWKHLGGKDRNSRSEQIRIGLKNIEQTKDGLTRSLGREPQLHELYMGHMLGANGAKQVLTASRDMPLIDVVKKFGGKNSNAIVNNNGMKGLTVGQAIDKWKATTDSHLSKIRNAKGADNIGRAVEAGHVPFGYTHINMGKYAKMEYGWGSKGKNNGIDCSGFIYRVMQDNGHQVPYMTTHQLYNNHGKHYDAVDTQAVKPGDILVWRYKGKSGDEVGHTGIVESFDPATGKVKYYGSQRSNGKGKKTGPAYAEFNVRSSDKVKFLRPKGADTNTQPNRIMLASTDAPQTHTTGMVTAKAEIQPVDAWANVDASTYAHANRFGYSNDFLTVAIQETTGIDLDGKPFTIDYNSIGEQIRTAESPAVITHKDVTLIPDIIYQPDSAYHMKLDDGSDGLQFFKTVDNERYQVTAKVDDIQMQVKSVQRENLDAPRQTTSTPYATKQADTNAPVTNEKIQSNVMPESGNQQINRVNAANKQNNSPVSEGNAKPEIINAKNVSENSGSQQGANNAPDSNVLLHDLLNEHPELRDIEIEAGTDRDGNPIKKKLSEVIEEIESEKNQQIKNAELFEKAAMCAFS